MRSFDFVIALIGTLILSPLYLIIALFIKLDSGGPVSYSQERVGLKGKMFRLYKFRSMVVNADSSGTSVTASRDPRITKVGRFLRKAKLDELPQLWNVLKGDMALVGPRPDVPEIICNYTSEMKRVLNVRPGITGTAALYLINEEELLSLADDPDRAYREIIIPAKIKLSMEHINNNSLRFNLLILIKTAWALTGGKILPVKINPVVRNIKERILYENESQKSYHDYKKFGADYSADIN